MNKHIPPALVVPEIISRKEAKAGGLMFYFTGMPCKYGHVEKRYVQNCGCVICLEIRASLPIYKAHRARAAKRWVERNPGKRAQILRNWVNANREHVNEWARNYRQKNIEKMRVRERNFYEKHREKRNEATKRTSRKAYLALAALKQLGIEI